MEFDPKWLTDPQVFQVNRLPAHASYMVRGADGRAAGADAGRRVEVFLCTDAGRLSAGILQGGI